MTENPLWRSVGGAYQCDGHYHAFCVLAPLGLAHPTKYRVLTSPPFLDEADAMAESIVVGKALYDTLRLRPKVLPTALDWDVEDTDDPRTSVLGEDIGTVAVKAVCEVERMELEEHDMCNAPGGEA